MSSLHEIYAQHGPHKVQVHKHTHIPNRTHTFQEWLQCDVKITMMRRRELKEKCEEEIWNKAELMN